MVLNIASNILEAAMAGGKANKPASSCEAVVAAMARVSAFSVVHLLRIARRGIFDASCESVLLLCECIYNWLSSNELIGLCQVPGTSGVDLSEISLHHFI